MTTPEKLNQWADQLEQLADDIRAEIVSPPPPPPPTPTPTPAVTYRKTPVVGLGYDDEGATILPNETNSRFLYVAIDGSDSNDGQSTSTPLATLDRANLVATADRQIQGVCLLGIEQNPSQQRWTRGSVDKTMPFVIKGRAAKVNLIINRDPVHNLALFGLHLIRPQIRVAGSGLLIEDCAIEIGEVQTDDRVPEDGIMPYQHVDIRLCDFMGGYNLDDTAQGLFLYGVEDWLIEGCLFFKNGWGGASRDDGIPSIGAKVRSHAIYIQNPGFPGVVVDCIIVDPSSHACHLRPGGLYFNNVMIGAPIGVQLGYVRDNKAKWGQPSGMIISNLFINGGMIDSANPRGWGIFLEHIKQSQVSGNDFVHFEPPFRGMAPIVVSQHSESIITEVMINNNRAFGWPGGVRGPTTGLTLMNNQLDLDTDLISDAEGMMIESAAISTAMTLRQVREKIAKLRSYLPPRSAA